MTDAPRIRLLIGYGQEIFPAVVIAPVFNADHPDDLAAAVDVPLALWQEYTTARERLARAEAAITDLDPQRPTEPAEGSPPP